MIEDLRSSLAASTALGPAAKAGAPARAEGAGRFAEALDEARGLKLSAHAEARLKSRDISLTASDWARIRAGVDRAAAKGAREALVISDKAALVVSVRNRTVITAMDPQQMREAVVTQIDSAVLV